jgi:hypothetical protein
MFESFTCLEKTNSYSYQIFSSAQLAAPLAGPTERRFTQTPKKLTMMMYGPSGVPSPGIMMPLGVGQAHKYTPPSRFYSSASGETEGADVRAGRAAAAAA